MKPVKKIIAIDIDDTLTESRNGLRLLVNKRNNLDLPLEAYQIPGEYWGYYERVWAEYGIKEKLSAKDFYEELHTDQTLTPLLPGAEFAIKELMKRFDIVLITAREARWEKYTQEWLEDQNFDKVPELYFCDAHRDSSAMTKGQIAKSLGAKWLIDDNVDHCISAQKEGLQPILFGNYGWQFDKPKDMLNLPDWPAVLDYFETK